MTKKTKTWGFRPDELEAYRAGGFQLIPLNRPDALDAKAVSYTHLTLPTNREV